MPAATMALMTVEEYYGIPEESGDFVYELHYGELVKVSRPKPRHIIRQDRIAELLRAALAGAGRVFLEFPFRAVPEHDLRAADVVFIRQERLKFDRDRDFFGAPDMVVEVLSPSNTAKEMAEKQVLCLENGCREFWIVDEPRFITVITPDGPPRTYRPGEAIPLTVVPNRSIEVDTIFSDEIGK